MSLPTDKGKGIAPEDYLDLERRFLKVSDDENPENAAQVRYLLTSLRGQEQGYSWPDILQNKIVIILGEPGSGKTTELKFKSEELRNKGKWAFFVRLDQLVTGAFDAALGEETKKSFNKWQQGQGQAIFFFDSVDESKLRKPDDFLTALDRISYAISVRHLKHATLIFSSRISEWRPATDLNEVRSRFPIYEQTGSAPQSKDESLKDKPLVVQIVPLDPVRVRRYAQWRNLPGVDAFIQVLDSQETDIVKQYAAAALRDCADPPALERLAEIAKGLSLLSNPLSAHLCEALYPNFIDAVELLNLIAKTEGTGHHHNNLHWVLDRHLQKTLTVALSIPLLRELIKLLQTEPYLNSYPGHELISQRYGWLCNILPLVLSKFLERTELNLEDAKIAVKSIRVIPLKAAGLD